MDVSGNKRRKLNYDKCTFCRKDKKKCDPPSRVWPQKCDRCEKNKLECSENKNLKATKSTPETADLGSEGSQYLVRCQELEIELSWLRRCGDHAARFETIRKPKYFPWTLNIKDVKSKIQERTEKILYQVSQLLHCPSSVARQAAFSVVSDVIRCRSTVDAESKVFQSELELRALLASSRASDRIDLELSLRECLLRAMDARNAHTEVIIDDLKDYTETYGRYIERIRQLEHMGDDDCLNPNKFSFPYNGDTWILGLLMRYSPEVLSEARDIFGCNALTTSVLIADQQDIEQLVSTMNDNRFLELTKDTGGYGFTILHIAALRGLNCVFDKIKKPSHQGLAPQIDSADCYGATPLLYAAMNGSCTTIRILMELGANPQILDGDYRNALHHAARKKGEVNAPQFVQQIPPLCAGQDIIGNTPATEDGRLEFIKLFFRQPYLGLLKNDNDIKIWLRLLHRASKSNQLQLIELLRYNRVVSQINQIDGHGQTALSMAAKAGNLGAVIALVTHGADVNISDHVGRTPWYHASQREDADMVSVLDGSLVRSANQ